MKSPFALLTSLATLMALSACGQTGPLTMPKPPARIPAANTHAAATGTTQNTATPAIQISPPAPAAGVTVPAAGSNANNTEAPNLPPPATQQ
ncbi:LPS translocon maturation chaperone LptM [Massilia luteola]|uniref:LPS translocon maturation chaperone LptM n=1 Tax=Massilia luteola TaxID=3081751 RepID=UPI002ACC110A|nr:lipoprotein [Massilia sp. Gc5]